MLSYHYMNCIHNAIFCIFLTATQLCAQGLPISHDTTIRKIGETLMREKGGIGLSVGILYKGQTYFYNFGSTEKNKQELPSQQSLYEIGSITKTFVGFLLAKAVNEGKVKFDDDIRKYLPRPYQNLEYDHQPIRLLDLANMTSGLPDNLPSPTPEILNAPADSVDDIRNRVISRYTIDTLFKALDTVKPATIPGTVPRHSNVGAQLLSYIIEKIYGQPIDVLIREIITQPLSMLKTDFRIPEEKSISVQGYDGKSNPAQPFANLYYRGAGGMLSCTEDLLKYLAFLMKQENINAKTVLKKTISIDAGTNKVIGIDPKDAVDPSKYSASVNWYHYTPEKRKTRIWTDGGTSGFASYIVMYPDADLGIIILSNKTGEKIFRSLPGMTGEILNLFLKAGK